MVEALLVLRGVPLPRVLPAKRTDVARRGHMPAMVKHALSDGPKRLREVVAHVEANRPELEPDFAYGCTLRVMVKMKAKSLVSRDGSLGGALAVGLAQDFGPDGVFVAVSKISRVAAILSSLL